METVHTFVDVYDNGGEDLELRDKKDGVRKLNLCNSCDVKSFYVQ